MSAPAEFKTVARTQAEEEALTALTAMQREAVAFRNGNVLVEAVPGSGKTRVIVARCLALLADAVAPSEILLLTFSRRAVGELRARLARSLEPDRMPEIRTFHGFAPRLLAAAGEAGRSRRLLSEPSERALFERIVDTMTFASLHGGVVRSAQFRDTAAARVAELRRAAPDALARLADRAGPRLTDLMKLEAEQKRVRAQLGVADYDDFVLAPPRLPKRPAAPSRTRCTAAIATSSSTSSKTRTPCSSNCFGASARPCSPSAMPRRQSTAFAAPHATHSSGPAQRSQ